LNAIYVGNLIDFQAQKLLLLIMQVFTRLLVSVIIELHRN